MSRRRRLVLVVGVSLLVASLPLLFLGSLVVMPGRSYLEARAEPVCNVYVERRGKRRLNEVAVLGAHYDSVSGSPGANDNGSGVAVLFELARAFAHRATACTVRFVFFVNEEPPYYRTDAMGSLVHARGARARGEDVIAMLSLETLAYYSTEPGSQRYPFPFQWFYPPRGDFVAFVGNLPSRALVRRAVGSFRKVATIPSEGLAAPDLVPGVGWSDHWSFWTEGVPAVMVTDTALFRDPAYHTSEDRPERLDAESLARVVSGLVAVAADLAGD